MKELNERRITETDKFFEEHPQKNPSLVKTQTNETLAEIRQKNQEKRDLGPSIEYNTNKVKQLEFEITKLEEQKNSLTKKINQTENEKIISLLEKQLAEINQQIEANQKEIQTLNGYIEKDTEHETRRAEIKEQSGNTSNKNEEKPGEKTPTPKLEEIPQETEPKTQPNEEVDPNDNLAKVEKALEDLGKSFQKVFHDLTEWWNNLTANNNNKKEEPKK
jgi:chromosome segregation ATPase